MSKNTKLLLLLTVFCIVVILFVVLFLSNNQTKFELHKLMLMSSDLPQVKVIYPFDGSVFPPELGPPEIKWESTSYGTSGKWVILFFCDGQQIRSFYLSSVLFWRPPYAVWEEIKKHCKGKGLKIVIAQRDYWRNKILAIGSVEITFAASPVIGSILYREVNLPFSEAVKDPSKIRWRFGSPCADSQPPVVLEKLPVCGNCHSFSAKGTILSMDVDYANDKGSYGIIPVKEKMTIDRKYIITWSDYKPEDGKRTFGLLSQVSPDGRYVISTVKDRSVFVARDDLAFSQLFFPIKGILAWYDTRTGKFGSLPGADDPTYVQSNPSWSPDGKTIIFARAPAYQLQKFNDEGQVLLTQEECNEFLKDGKPFKFDLYRIDFNEGKGGTALPIEGASKNGKSNFFGRFSPDSRWIVFCQSANYMLLQPDSELFIIPSQGGTARRLECNLWRMNSWHSWSPDGKWLIFSSKAFSEYTQLFIAPIDENGHSRPPVLLDHLVSPSYAANIPEFVALPHTAIKVIQENFVDALSLVRAATEVMRGRDYQKAEKFCREAINIDPRSKDAWCLLGEIMFAQRQFQSAYGAYNKALESDAGYARALAGIAPVLFEMGRINEGEMFCRKAVEKDPSYSAGWSHLSIALMCKGRVEEAIQCAEKAIGCDPEDPALWVNYAFLAREKGDIALATEKLQMAVKLNPDNPQIHNNYGTVLHESGKLQEAETEFREALKLEPSYLQAKINLATVLMALNKFEEAEKFMKDVLREDSENISVLFKLARLFRMTTRYTEAKGCLEAVLPKMADDPEVLTEAAYLYAESSGKNVYNSVKALEFARKACQLTGYSNCVCLDALAVAQAANGDFLNALRTEEKALDVARATAQKIYIGLIEEHLKKIKNKVFPFEE